jgi:aldose 1-epimerase
MDKSAFKGNINGKPTDLYILNHGSMQAAVTNYGGRLAGLTVPDSQGKLTDVVAGFASVQDYVKSSERYYGATIGRFANRIAKGKFTLDGTEYSLFTNNGPNSLHGGKKGFQDVVWDATQVNDHTLLLSYFSPDMEEGYPGNLQVNITVMLTGNAISFSYEATTDKKTVINLTNHAYFNLNGEGSGTINGHLLQVNASAYTPVDETLIPTGELAAVEGTPFDFMAPVAIGARVNDDHAQLRFGKGYDHNFVLEGTHTNGMLHAATARGDQSGIVMEVHTSEPGLQFYGGNFMKGDNRFKSGVADDLRTTFCLETQHFPDSPNQPGFPSTVLEPGQVYRTKTEYRFKLSSQSAFR